MAARVGLRRRRFLKLAGAAVALAAAPRIATAGAYPSQPVHLVVGLAPGGGVDILARLIGDGLSRRLGVPFIVDNRPGAATNIATEFVVKAAPDGYTLLQVATPAAINGSLYGNLGFDFIRDIAPVASIGRSTLVVVVNPSFPARTLAELVAYAKANPGKANYGSSGIGTPLHVAAELFCLATGIRMIHVPYRGSAPALADLLGGQVEVMFSDPSALPLIQSGKLRALAVTTARRWDELPDVPSVGESIAGYEASVWQGVGAPRDTPADVVATLNTAINAAMADAGIKARLAALGFTPFASSPAEFGRFIADETAKWARVVRTANINPQ
jgi:tripartite-type tricarboxylate transporter receptor subunit TctC